MQTEYIQFTNEKGLNLSARLERPVGIQSPVYAIFAHCFTCGKNSKVATRVSRSLTQLGYAVLRFDFTGLGDSEGELGNSGFGSNIDDIVAAAKYLESNYKSPELLIGHSLGGTASIHAAEKIKSVKAVCSVAAPAQPNHVWRLFTEDENTVREKGHGTVKIENKTFTVGTEFIEELENHQTLDVIRELKKAVLLFHSPQDQIVAIENAAKLYDAAFHPKSFISLDKSDHLISDEDDMNYVAEVIGSWAKRYVSRKEKEGFDTDKQVAVQIGSDGYTSEVIAGKHSFLADEPKKFGGNDLGPSPYQLLSAALGTCTAMTLRMYAERKEWDTGKITVHLSHSKSHAEDVEGIQGSPGHIEVFERWIELEASLDQEKQDKLLEIANKCPVHRTLLDSEIKVETSIR